MKKNEEEKKKEKNGGGTRPIQNTSQFLGLHASTRDAPHQSTDAKKIYMKRGHIHVYINTWTLQLLDRIGPVGRFGENIEIKLKQ